MSVKVLVLFGSFVVYLVLSTVWFGGWTFQMFQMMEAEVHVPTMFTPSLFSKNDAVFPFCSQIYLG
jgi:hypothetical protein